jgi:hypothetical protein
MKVIAFEKSLRCPSQSSPNTNSKMDPKNESLQAAQCHFVGKNYGWMDAFAAFSTRLAVDLLTGLSGADVVDQKHSPNKLPAALIGA